MINRYTIIGQPVAHSLSPAIHHMFGELTHRRVAYTRSEATETSFRSTVLDWRDSGGKGCNITAPFKELATDVCDRLSESASRAAAVNTIEMHRDGSLVGHNTDGTGLLADLKTNKRLELTENRILILGAGGAVRGALAPLLSANPSVVHIANRSVGRATTLAEAFSDLGNVSASSYDQLANEAAFDIVINATSMGFDNDTPSIPPNSLTATTFAYDMMYSATTTPFLNWCKQNNVENCSDGFGMLVEQAADAYLIWEGVRPKTRKVYLATSEILSSV